jgi:hypothetical protein
MCAQMEAGQDARQRMVNDKLAVSELATTALIALPPIVRLRELAEVLRGSRHQAFPVTPDVKAALQSGAHASLLHGSCPESACTQCEDHQESRLTLTAEPAFLISLECGGRRQGVAGRCVGQRKGLMRMHAHANANADAGFPLHGVVTRAQLLRLLKARIGLCAADSLQRPPPSGSRIPATQAPRYPPAASLLGV